MYKTIDIIARKTASKTVLNNQGNLSVLLTEPSVIQIHGAPTDVARYVRQGKDLLIYMKDGSVVRCSNYFALPGEDSERPNELVFTDDNRQIAHITFDDSGNVRDMALTPLSPQATPISTIAPFIAHGSQAELWGWVAGGVLVGGGVGALLASGGGGGSHHSETVTPVETLKPSFVVYDDVGDKQGVLSSGALTDDTTPTFQGTGQPGSTIQIKDANGNTIASTQVGSNGTWSVVIPAQAAGSHTWSVVQINGSTVTAGGSITLQVVTAKASITVDAVSGDDVINAGEAANSVLIGGRSSELAAGTALTVTLNGKQYTTTVESNGHWQVSVPAADAAKLAQGTYQITASATDSTGNHISGDRMLAVDTLAPSLGFDKVAGDNIINADEKAAAVTLSGTSSAEAGQTVTVTLGAKSWSTTVGSDGKWTLNIPQSDIAALSDGTQSFSVSVADKAGNVTTKTLDVLVDTVKPTVSFDVLAGDDILNAEEQTQVLIISGKTNALPGNKVVVVFNGKEYLGVVQDEASPDGGYLWRIGVPAKDMVGMSQDVHDVAVTVTTASGNTTTEHHALTFQTVAPEVSLDSFTLSSNLVNVLNTTDLAKPLTLCGSTNLSDGAQMTITLNGKTYYTVAQNGSWSVEVPVGDLQGLGNTTHCVEVTCTDHIGNTQTASMNVLVDAVQPSVYIGAFVGNNQLGNADVQVAQTLQGEVRNASAGDTVTVVIGGKTHSTTVGADLSWRVNVSSDELKALGDGLVDISATVTTHNGNSGNSASQFDIKASLPGVRIDTLSGDNVINVLEHQQALAITGSVENLPAGSKVVVTVNHVSYDAIVDASGRWTVGLDSQAVSALPAGPLDVTAQIIDAGHNTASYTQTIVVDLDPVAISIANVTQDNIINASEQAAGVRIYGMTTGVEAGKTVVLSFGGYKVTADVQQDGSWSYQATAAQCAALKEGTLPVSVTVTNGNGVSVQSSTTALVDTKAPEININAIADNNVLNADEATRDLVISGTTTAEAGRTMTVTFGGSQQTAVVQTDGSWSVTFSAAMLATLADGEQPVRVSVSDIAGNPATAGRAVLVDTQAPEIIQIVMAGNNVINIDEHGHAQIISGSSQNGTAGDVVTVTVGTFTATTVLDAEGNWSVGVPAETMASLSGASVTVNVSVVDSAGNSSSTPQSVRLALTPPTVTIDTVTNDDVINSDEKAQGITLTGGCSEANARVTVNLNGLDYTVMTDEDGKWSLAIAPADLARLGEAQYTLTASVADADNNVGLGSKLVLVDTTAPIITIDVVAGDDIINAIEIGSTVTISGTAKNVEPNTAMTITLNGVPLNETVTLDNDLNWSFSLTPEQMTALGNGELMIKASVTNLNGNSAVTERDVTIDADIPGIRIDTLAGDDVLNIIELQQGLVISGTSEQVAEGATVTLTVNGVSHTCTVQADGSWSYAINASEVAGWKTLPSPLIVSAEVANNAGVVATTARGMAIDIADVAVSINPVTQDNVVNLAEQAAGITLSGSTVNVEAGQSVTVIFAGHQYQAVVKADGSWSQFVSAGDLASLRAGVSSVQVSVSNQHGNVATAEQHYSADLQAPTLLVDAVHTTDLINHDDLSNGFTLSGESNAEAGQKVSITLGGETYSGIVGADGRWQIDLPKAAAGLLNDGVQGLPLSVSDKAGNATTVTHQVLVDAQLPVVTIDTFAGDNVVNATEHQQAQIISGHATNAQAGDKVTVEISDGAATQAFYTMLDAAGNWSIGLPASTMKALAEGQYTITASVTDRAGNVGETPLTFAVNLTPPALTIDQIAGDDFIINHTEQQQGVTVVGTAEANCDITVQLNGKQYTTASDASGKWSVSVPAADLARLGEAQYSVTVTATDGDGNVNQASQSVRVDTVAPAVIIDAITADNMVSVAELSAYVTISGSVVGAEVGQSVTLTVAGQMLGTVTVGSDLTWSLALSDAQMNILRALGGGELSLQGTVTNQSGNTGSGSHDFLIDLTLPGIRIDVIAGDDVVNRLEHNQPIVLSGTATGAEEGTKITVTASGKDYTAWLNADGSWSCPIPAQDVAQWAAGEIQVSASIERESSNGSTIERNVMVDLADAAISINPITGDNVLNAADASQSLTFSGQTANVEAGQIVTLTLNGIRYTTVVQGDGSWSLNVNTAALQALHQGSEQIQVSVSSATGNPASASQTFWVDTVAPALQVDTVAGDDVINLAEATAGVTVSGHSDAEAGQVVKVLWNGLTETAVVDSDGNWTVTFAVTDPSALTQGGQAITVAVSDKAGNETTFTHMVRVDTLPPVITVFDLTDDNLLNRNELSQAQIISGTCTQAEAGDQVTVVINGKNYTTTLDAQGKWSVGIPAADMSALSGTEMAMTVTVTDRAGNTSSLPHTVAIDTALPAIQIDNITYDNVINVVEKGAGVTISGSDVKAGLMVTVTLNGISYQTQAQDDGRWSVNVSPADLALLGEALYTVTASVTSESGNSNSVSKVVTVDTALPIITIDSFVPGDVINAGALAGQHTLTGTVTNPSLVDKVVITLGGETYTADVNPNGTWSCALEQGLFAALGNGELTIQATVTNQHGNVGEASRNVLIDANQPGIRIDTVAGDDVINSLELQQPMIISGTTREVAAGSSVEVSIDSYQISTLVQFDGSWSLVIPGNIVSGWKDFSQIKITANVSDESGNIGSISHLVAIDSRAVAITIDDVAQDNIINAGEQLSGFILTGSCQGVEAGQQVTIILGGFARHTVVESDGNWSCYFDSDALKNLCDGVSEVQVSVSSLNGNMAQASQMFMVDITAPTLNINTVAGDNMINAAEATALEGVTLSGTTSAEPEQQVLVKLSGVPVSFSTMVNNDGTWSLTLDPETLAECADGVLDITVTVKDKAGNETVATRQVIVDTVKPVVGIDDFASDNVINASEHAHAQVVSGTCSGVTAGTLVKVTIDGHTYTTAVDASGKWSVGIPMQDIAALVDESYNIDVTVSDAAGNVGSGTRAFTVQTLAPQLSITPLEILNDEGTTLPLAVNGTSSLGSGFTVTVMLAGKTYTTTTDNYGNWSLAISEEDLQLLGNTQYALIATITDNIGNSTTTQAPLLVDTTLPLITIDSIAGNDIVNSIEAQNPVTISGMAKGAKVGSFVTVIVGGITLAEAVVDVDGRWSTSLTTEQIAQLGNGALDVSASAINDANNIGYAERLFTIATEVPGIRIDKVTGDNVINQAEQESGFFITGSTSGVARGSLVKVTVTLAGGAEKTYPDASTDAQGNWIVRIPSEDAATWDANVTVTATVMNSAGNQSTISQGVTVDTAPVSLSIDPVTSDNVLSAAEKGNKVTISGGATNVDDGQTVWVTIAGHQEAATVNSGRWSVDWPAEDVAALPDGSITVLVSTANAIGNAASNIGYFTIDTTPPMIAVAPLNVLNADVLGDGETVTIHGVSDAIGQRLTVTIGTASQTVTVGDDGTWEVDFDAQDIKAAEPTGNPTSGEYAIAVTASVSDAAGNEATASQTLQVDITPPDISFDETNPTLINAAAKGHALVISGSSDGEAGDSVAVMFNGKSYLTQLDVNGRWSVGIPAEKTALLPDGTQTVEVTITDKAGNSGIDSFNIIVDTSAPTLTIDTPAVDGVLNASEKADALTVTGTTSLAEGTKVFVTLAGIEYEGSVGSDGKWSATLTAEALAGLGDTRYIITASATSASGNPASCQIDLLVDTRTPSVSINSVGNNDIINTEMVGGLTLSGRVVGAEAGSEVKISLGGVEVTALVNSDLTWSTTVTDISAQAALEALGSGKLSIVASVTNAHGNIGIGSHDVMLNLDTAGIRIDPVSNDDVINIAEKGQDLLISGTTSKLYLVGEPVMVTVTIGGIGHQAAVAADGTWMVLFRAGDITNWGNSPLVVSATVTDNANNTAVIDHPVTLATDPVSIGINPVTDDNILNQAECTGLVHLSGNVDGIEDGQSVVVMVGTLRYTTTVENGGWSWDLDASALAALGQGEKTITVSTASKAGNPATNSHTFTIDTVAPRITVDPLTADNVINSEESGQTVVISGQSDAEAGQTVTISLGGNNIATTTVDSNGRWSVEVAGAALVASQGSASLSVTVSDRAGNSTTNNHAFTVDTVAPTATFDSVTADNVINLAEKQQALILSGGSENGSAGDKVEVVFGTQTYTTILDQNGNWSVGISAAQMQALNNTTSSFTVTLTDSAGNSHTESKAFSIDIGQPTLTINPLAGDDVLNASERGDSLTISGTADVQLAGKVVTVTLGGLNYTATVDDTGLWSLAVTARDLALLADTRYTVTASVTGETGNTTTATHDLLVDTRLPVVTIDALANNNIINEAASGLPLTITGKVSGAAATDALYINVGGTLVQATVNADLTWTATVAPSVIQGIGDGELTILASVINAHGNKGTASRDILIDTGLPGVRIETVAGDDIINLAESQQELVIHGSTSGLGENGTVSLIINGVTTQVAVLADGSWVVAIDKSTVAGWGGNAVTIHAVATDGAGNSASIDRLVTIDSNPVSIAIDSLTDDNIISASDMASTITLSGTAIGVDGQEAVITLGGLRYTALVENGVWAVELPAGALSGLAEGAATVQVSVTSASGNPAQASQQFTVDTVPPTLTALAVTADNIINASEALADVTLTGLTDAPAGQTVVVTINNVAYNGTVLPDGTWAVALTPAVIASLGQGDITYTVALSDKARNPASLIATMQVDTQAPDISIDVIAGDDIINLAEMAQALVLTGTTSGAQLGDRVTVSFAGQTYHTIVDGSGNWSVGVPASVMTALSADGSVSVEISDAAGNTSTSSRAFHVDNGLPTLTFDAISTDNVLNASEQNAVLVISGGSSGLAAGVAVTVAFAGKNYLTTVAADGRWTVNVQPSDLALLNNIDYTLTATASGASGNTGHGSAVLTVDNHPPVVMIDPIAAINNLTIGLDLTLTGRVSGASVGDTVSISVGGKGYTATVGAGLTWTTKISALDLLLFGDGSLNVVASVTNAHGNTGTGISNLLINSGTPSIRVDTVSGDDVINAIEHNQDLVISGSGSGLKVGSNVSVKVNNKTYIGIVAADGTWSVGVTGADVSAWPAGNVAISVTGQNSIGGTVTLSHNVTVDLSPVAISINDVTSDNILNASEAQSTLTLSGTTQNVAAGQLVTITFAGKTWHAQVDAQGNWSLDVPAADLATLTQGNALIQASVTNETGVSASTGHTFIIDTIAPQLRVDLVTADDVVNIAEAASGVKVTGTSDAPAGAEVTVILNGNTYSGNVNADGSWEVTLPPDALNALGSGAFSYQVSVSDKAGNVQSVSKTLNLDLIPPTISVDVVAGDDILNLVEHTQAQIVSGTTTGTAVGDKVSVTLNGKTYTTVVGDSGRWSIGLPAADVAALNNGAITLTAAVTDRAGNSATALHDITVNTANIMLTIDKPSGDGVLNAAEAGGDLLLTGSSHALPDGSLLNITFNGKLYTTTVANDRWSLTIANADLVGLTEGASYRILVSAKDAANNTAEVSDNLLVNTTPPLIIIAPIAGDDVVNLAEHGQPLTLSGTTTAGVGQTLTITLNGKTYTTTVKADGSWSYAVSAADVALLPEGALQVAVSVQNSVGNTGEKAQPFTVDLTPPTITFDTVAGDDQINAAEQLLMQTISGKTSAEAGQTLTLTFAGHTYTAVVKSGGLWSVDVSPRDFIGLVDGKYTLSATVQDKAGNASSATHDVMLNGERPTISINTVAGDDVINAVEQGTALTISGTTSAPQGAEVSITLNGQTYQCTVTSSGTWSLLLGATIAKGLVDGQAYEITASVANAIGNVGMDTRSIIVDITPPQATIAIVSLEGDSGLWNNDFITNVGAVTLNGTLSTILANNEKAQISLDGGTNWVDLVVNGTNWRYSDSRTLADGSWNYQVRVVDSAGNVGATASQNVVIDRVVPDASETILVDRIVTDTGLSDSDFITSDRTFSLEGHLGAALKAGEYLQISLNGGAWVNVAVNGLSWAFPSGASLADGTHVYQLRVIDAAGNVGQTASQTVVVDTVSPDIANLVTITHIVEDTGLSSSDFVTSATSLTVHGKLTSALGAGEFVQISLDGGVSWTNATTVGTDWYYTDARALTDGGHDYWVRVVDTAGNVGATAKQTVIVDTIKPDEAITIQVEGITQDTGFDAHDYLTSDRSPTLYGTLGQTLGQNEFLQISLDNGATWETITVGYNATDWRYAESRQLLDGQYHYLLRIVDLAGNVSETASQSLWIDGTAPVYGITIDDISEDTGQSASDFITMSRTLTLEGSIGQTLAGDERVQISLDGGRNWLDAEVDGMRWQYSDDRTLIDGDYTYQVRIIDDAGNVGSTAEQVVVVDNVAPDSIGTILYSTDQTGDLQGNMGSDTPTDERNPTLYGTVNVAVEEGALVELYRTDTDGKRVRVGAIEMGNALSWSLADNLTGYDDGRYTYVLRITDKAGNYTESRAFTYFLDTRIPTTTATIVDQTTSDTTPILSGLLSAALTSSEYLEVKIGNQTFDSRSGDVVVNPANHSWYLQVPDALALANYTVSTQVKSRTGNGNAALVKIGSLTVTNEVDVTPTWTGTADAYTNGMSYSMDSSGQWVIAANRSLVTMTGLNTYRTLALTSANGYTTMTTMMDYNRDGALDVINARSRYNDYNVDLWTGSANGSYSQGTAPVGLAIWYGAVVAFDREGDGYIDFAIGDAGGPDSSTFIWNTNGTLSSGSKGGGTITVGQKVGTYSSLVETSGVDLNNDGRVDLVQHVVASGNNYSMASLMNQGDGSFNWGFAKTNIFYSTWGGDAVAANAVAMTWADFDGDGFMDLYLPGIYGATAQGTLMLNNRLGDLTLGVSVGGTLIGTYSVAVDWNHDGKMDIIKIGSTVQSSLYTNTGNASFSESKIGAASSYRATGAAAIDYNWDGAVDLLIARQNGKAEVVLNTNTVAQGTALHVKILDAAGLNVFYGNTVNLYDSGGKLVAAQVLNAQSGIGVNDSSAMLSFYGLDPRETYHLSMKYLNNGVVNTIGTEGRIADLSGADLMWGELKPGAATDSYVLSVEHDGDTNNGNFVGTGYNDTFIATGGVDTYDGAGGTEFWSEHGTWSATGGMDIVDFKLSDVGVTADLGISVAQNTGFNTSTFKNIEGLAGSDFADIFTGNSGDNQFEGRGGDDTFNIGSGGRDTLLYKLLDAGSATGGNGHDTVNGFSLGTWENMPDADRIDLSDLLRGSGYTGNDGAHFVDGVASLDNPAGTLGNYLRVTTDGSNTLIDVNLSGQGFETLLTITGVQTDLATLLANHQLIVG